MGSDWPVMSPIRKLSRNGVLEIEVMDRNKHQNTTADYCFLNDNVLCRQEPMVRSTVDLILNRCHCSNLRDL
jgi:hypothetical protein